MTTTANQQNVNHNDEKKHFCRLCHGTDDDSNTHLAGIDQEWIHPCKCSGSIKWVHRGCFKAWHDQATEQQRTRCSICSYSFRFSLRLKPRWFTEMHIFYWIPIFLGEMIIYELFSHIATSNYVSAFLSATVFCVFLVLMYGLQLLLLKLYKTQLEDFQWIQQMIEQQQQHEQQMFAVLAGDDEQLAEQLAGLVDDGGHDYGLATVAPTNYSLFEESVQNQNAK